MLSAASFRCRLRGEIDGHPGAPPLRSVVRLRRSAALAQDNGNQGNGVTVDQLEAVVAKASLVTGERMAAANAELQVALEKERSAREVALEKERSARKVALEKERSSREVELQKQRYLNFFLFGGLFVVVLSSAAPDSFVYRLFQGVLFQVLPK